MKITVGGIVFNGVASLPDGMLEAWLSQIYKIGDEIIIVEGATKAISHYWDGDTSWATTDGSSTDNTIDVIKSFPDPEKKIKLIQANGFWNGKTHMTNEWAKHMTGDYIWMISTDEFYMEKDVEKIKNILETKRPDQIDFYANHFWGDFRNCVNENTGHGWANEIPWERIHRHVRGARWARHEPPLYLHPDGLLTCQKILINREETLKMGIKMYHYSFVSKKQIDFKQKFYKNDSYKALWKKWKEDHNTPLIHGDTTVSYNGEHPESIREVIHEHEK
jgi:hypothetical protein